MSKTVTDYTAILSGKKWGNQLGNGSSAIISYSFYNNSNLPPLYAGETHTYSKFTAAQKKNFRKVIAEFESVSGLKFVEVKNIESADIRVVNASGSPYAGWSYYPPEDHSSWHVDLVIDDRGNYNPGSYAYETMLHELGHAVGLEHPFEGKFVLPKKLDNEDNTLMSYTSNNVNDRKLAYLDVDALEFIYGQRADVSGIKVRWNENKQLFTATGTSGDDAFTGIYASSILLGGNGNDKLVGRANNDKIFGNAGQDKLFTSGGVDFLNGGGDNDLIFIHKRADSRTFAKGGSGDDIFYLRGTMAKIDGGGGSNTVSFRKGP